MTAKKSTPSRGTKSTEIVIGSGATKMRSAATMLFKVVDEIKTMQGEYLEELQTKIADKEARLDELEITYKEATRVGKLNVDAELKEYGITQAKNICHASGFAVVRNDEYADVKNGYDRLKKEFENEVTAKVSAARSEVLKDSKNATDLLLAQHKAEIAQKEADLTAAKKNIEMLTLQVESWKNALDAERAAGVERAKAASIGAVNVSSTPR